MSAGSTPLSSQPTAAHMVLLAAVFSITLFTVVASTAGVSDTPRGAFEASCLSIPTHPDLPESGVLLVKNGVVSLSGSPDLEGLREAKFTAKNRFFRPFHVGKADSSQPMSDKDASVIRSCKNHEHRFEPVVAAGRSSEMGSSCPTISMGDAGQDAVTVLLVTHLHWPQHPYHAIMGPLGVANVLHTMRAARKELRQKWNVTAPVRFRIVPGDVANPQPFLPLVGAIQEAVFGWQGGAMPPTLSCLRADWIVVGAAPHGFHRFVPFPWTRFPLPPSIRGTIRRMRTLIQSYLHDRCTRTYPDVSVEETADLNALQDGHALLYVPREVEWIDYRWRGIRPEIERELLNVVLQELGNIRRRQKSFIAEGTASSRRTPKQQQPRRSDDGSGEETPANYNAKRDRIVTMQFNSSIDVCTQYRYFAAASVAVIPEGAGLLGIFFRRPSSGPVTHVMPWDHDSRGQLLWNDQYHVDLPYAFWAAGEKRTQKGVKDVRKTSSVAGKPPSNQALYRLVSFELCDDVPASFSALRKMLGAPHCNGYQAIESSACSWRDQPFMKAVPWYQPQLTLLQNSIAQHHVNAVREGVDPVAQLKWCPLSSTTAPTPVAAHHPRTLCVAGSPDTLVNFVTSQGIYTKLSNLPGGWAGKSVALITTAPLGAPQPTRRPNRSNASSTSKTLTSMVNLVAALDALEDPELRGAESVVIAATHRSTKANTALSWLSTSAGLPELSCSDLIQLGRKKALGITSAAPSAPLLWGKLSPQCHLAACGFALHAVESLRSSAHWWRTNALIPERGAVAQLRTALRHLGLQPSQGSNTHDLWNESISAALDRATSQTELPPRPDHQLLVAVASSPEVSTICKSGHIGDGVDILLLLFANPHAAIHLFPSLKSAVQSGSRADDGDSTILRVLRGEQVGMGPPLAFQGVNSNFADRIEVHDPASLQSSSVACDLWIVGSSASPQAPESLVSELRETSHQREPSLMLQFFSGLNAAWCQNPSGGVDLGIQSVVLLDSFGPVAGASLEILSGKQEEHDE